MRRHPLDPLSLIFGIAFAALGATLLDTDKDVTDLSGSWVLPLPLLLVGLALLGIALARLRDASQPVAAEPGADDTARTDTDTSAPGRETPTGRDPVDELSNREDPPRPV